MIVNECKPSRDIEITATNFRKPSVKTRGFQVLKIHAKNGQRCSCYPTSIDFDNRITVGTCKVRFFMTTRGRRSIL